MKAVLLMAKNKIYHSDLKPANLIIVKEKIENNYKKILKIIDLG